MSRSLPVIDAQATEARSLARGENRLLGIPDRIPALHPRIAAQPRPGIGDRRHFTPRYILGPEDQLNVEDQAHAYEQPGHLDQAAKKRTTGSEFPELGERQR